MSSNDIKCKGCFSYGKEDDFAAACDLPPTHGDVECPCLTCLIKGVCRYFSDCKKIIEYNKLIRL